MECGWFRGLPWLLPVSRSYGGLLRKEDGPSYELVQFHPDRIKEHFRVFLVTSALYPDPELVALLYPLVILPSGAQ